MSQAIIDQAFVIVRLRKWGEGWRTNALAKQTEVETLRTKMRVMDEEHTALAGERDQIRANLIQTESESRAAFDELRVQVQDQRAEIERLQWENKTMHKDAEDGYAEAIKVLGDPIALSKERDALRAEVAQHRKEHDGDQQAIVGLLSERDKLRAEVAAFRAEVATLQERLLASIARGDFAEIEVDRLKAQSTPTPKQHPAKVGEWVKKTTDGLMYKIGEKFRLKSYEIKDGQIWCNLDNGASWLMSVCEPCDPPVDHDTPAGKEAAKAVIRDSQMTEIKAGTKLRLCKVPMPDPQLSGLVDFPWNAEWGSVGDVAEVINTLNPASLPAVAVRLESELVVWWPRSCIEIVRKVPQ